MFFLVNLTLVLCFSVLILNCINIKGRVAFLLGIYVIGYANIVFIEELAGLFGVLTRQTIFALHLLFTLLAFFIWKKFGDGDFLRHFIKNFSGFSISHLWKIVKTYPEVAVLTLGVVIAYLIGAGWILVVPPITSDSMTYHLSRVGYWMQYHSFYPWTTTNVRQTVFPMNVELGFLWTILGWGTDQLTGFVQWVSAVVVVLSIYGVSRLMGYSRLISVTVALLFPTLTQPLFQSISTQNDLTTAALWSCVTFYYFTGMKSRKVSYFILSAIAFGLAVGAKSTSLIILPAWALFVVLSYLLDRQGIGIHIKQWALVAIVSVFLLGSYIYVQNYIAYGSLLGPEQNTERVTAGREQGIGFRLQLLRDNLGRYVYQMTDFSPLPNELSVPLNRFKQTTFGFVFSTLHIPIDNAETYAAGRKPFQLSYFNDVNQDRSWFGPLMIFLVFSIMAQTIKWKQHREAIRLAPLIFLGGFLVLHSAAQLWTIAKGRYYILPVAISFPAMAFILSSRSTKLSRILRVVLISLGLLSMFATLANQHVLNIIPDIISLRRRAPGWENVLAFKYVSQGIPYDSDIGLVANSGNFRDYPLFGTEFVRSVHRFPIDRNNLHYLTGNSKEDYLDRFQQSDYIFLAARNKDTDRKIVPTNFSLALDTGAYSVWARDDIFSTLNSCENPQWPLSELFAIDEELHCMVWAQFPLISPSENAFNLVNDPDTSFQVRLYSLENRRVLLGFTMTPLRSEATNHQTGIRLLQNGELFYSENFTVDDSSRIIIKIDLPKGETLLDIGPIVPPLSKGESPAQWVEIKRISIRLP